MRLAHAVQALPNDIFHIKLAGDLEQPLAVENTDHSTLIVEIKSHRPWILTRQPIASPTIPSKVVCSPVCKERGSW